MATGYDRVFEFAPQFGLYQLYLFVCAYFAACSIYGPFLTASVFFQYEPAHRCRSSVLERNHAHFNNIFIQEHLASGSCKIREHKIESDTTKCTGAEGSGQSFDIDVTFTESNWTYVKTEDEKCVAVADTVETCDNFVYSTNEMNVTITTENNLVCSKGWIDEILTVTTMIGMTIGPTLSGIVSDRIGRIMSIVLFCFITFGFSLINGCLGSYHWGIYGVFRLLSVIGSSGIGITYFVVIMESTGDKYRPRLGLLYITTTIGVGVVMLSFVTMGLRNWQHVQFVMAGVCCLIAFVTRTIMETPRWLYAHNKYKQARVNVRKMASWSSMEIEEKTFDEFENELQEADKVSPPAAGGIVDLFRQKRTRETTIIIMINQFVRGIINYGFLFNIGRLSGNIYSNNIINNLMGIPAFLILCITIDNKWLGRKGNFVITLWLAGLSSYCIFFGKMFDVPHMASVSSFVGMFASTAATSVGYVYTAEVYPTEIRNVGVGCCSSCAMAGALISPLMGLLEDYIWWLTPIINGTLALLAGCLSFQLPETNNEPMTTTIEEFEIKYGEKKIEVTEKSGIENDGYQEDKF